MGVLIDNLKKNSESDVYPFHMPGHKRKISGENPYNYDITEINGFDDLHAPEGILKSLNERIAEKYGAGRAWVLVNGSSSGVLAAVSACVRPGQKILMARNCHKSAYNAVMLRRIKTEYIYPPSDERTGISLAINAEDVDKALCDDGEIKAVLITSPTYEGVISDIEKISGAVHSHGAVLIVDCAHGAHLGIDGGHTVNPLRCGADIVIMSLHKTLPSMTQTAVLCAGGNSADYEALNRYVDVYTSTSPSYVLMSSVERCFDIIDRGGLQIWKKYYTIVSDFREKCEALKNLYLWQADCRYDSGKIVIATDRADINGHQLMSLLRDRYHLELEMESAEYVLAMTSCCDDEEGMDRLLNALLEIDGQLHPALKYNSWITPRASRKYEAFETEYMDKNRVLLKDAEGKTCGACIYAYPPGIPWVVPGEVFTGEIVNMIENSSKQGICVHGVSDSKVDIIGE